MLVLVICVEAITCLLFRVFFKQFLSPVNGGKKTQYELSLQNSIHNYNFQKMNKVKFPSFLSIKTI